MPLISIIVPIYNIERFLPRCIDSILKQKCHDYELILVDDGSKDESGKICEKYASKDSRIRVFHKENGGVSSARNLGIANATGEWMVFIDGDDWIDPYYLNVVKLHSDKNVDVLHFGYKRVLSDGTVKDEIPVDEGYIDSGKLIGSGNWASTSFSYAFRARLVKKYNIIFPVGLRTSEDRIFISCCVLRCGIVYNIKESHYYYEFTPGSAVNSKHPYSKNRGDILAADMINKYVVENKIEWEPSSKQWFMESTALSHLRDDILISTDIWKSLSLIYSDYRILANLIDIKKSTFKFRFLFWSMQNFLPIAYFYEKYLLRAVRFYYKIKRKLFVVI